MALSGRKSQEVRVENKCIQTSLRCCAERQHVFKIFGKHVEAKKHFFQSEELVLTSLLEWSKAFSRLLVRVANSLYENDIVLILQFVVLVKMLHVRIVCVFAQVCRKLFNDHVLRNNKMSY